jgi:hypothetical protein
MCPVTGVHTQHVENFNNKIMLKIKEMKGLTDTGRDFLLVNFVFWTLLRMFFIKILELFVFNFI